MRYVALLCGWLTLVRFVIEGILLMTIPDRIARFPERNWSGFPVVFYRRTLASRFGRGKLFCLGTVFTAWGLSMMYLLLTPESPAGLYREGGDAPFTAGVAGLAPGIQRLLFWFVLFAFGSALVSGASMLLAPGRWTRTPEWFRGDSSLLGLPIEDQAKLRGLRVAGGVTVIVSAWAIYWVILGRPQ